LDQARTYEIELDWCGLLDVRRTPIATGFCVAENFRDVATTGVRVSFDHHWAKALSPGISVPELTRSADIKLNQQP
jgi:hypothetical protein